MSTQTSSTAKGPRCRRTPAPPPPAPLRPLSSYRRRCGHSAAWLAPCVPIDLDDGSVLVVSARATEQHTRCAACVMAQAIDDGLIDVRGDCQTGFWLAAMPGARARAELLDRLTHLTAPHADLPHWPHWIEPKGDA